MFVMSYIVLYMNSKQSKFNHWKRIYYFFEIPEYQNLEWQGQKRLSSKLQKWKLQSNSKGKRSLVRIIILIWFAVAKNCKYIPNVFVFIFILKWNMYINSVKKIKQAVSMYMYFLLSPSSPSNTCIDVDHCDVQLKRKIQILLLPSILHLILWWRHRIFANWKKWIYAKIWRRRTISLKYIE